jgi:hypothetical protein
VQSIANFSLISAGVRSGSAATSATSLSRYSGNTVALCFDPAKAERCLFVWRDPGEADGEKK